MLLEVHMSGRDGRVNAMELEIVFLDMDAVPPVPGSDRFRTVNLVRVRLGDGMGWDGMRWARVGF